MNPTLAPTNIDSVYNAFKNNNVQKGNLALPTSLGINQVYTTDISFQLSQTAAFLQGYVYATDYGDYFNFTDSQYHDGWRQINTNNDFLVFSSGSLLNYFVRMTLAVDRVTFTLYLRGIGSAVTITHPTFKVPITFIDYSLAN